MKKIITLVILAILVVCSSSARVVRTTLINTDFSDGKALQGWGGTISVSDGVCELKNPKVGNPWDSQACINGSIPEGATVTMKIKAKASVAYTLACGLQKSNGYAGRGDFEAMSLTTEFQEFTKTVVCNGEGADRVLLNFGTIDGSVYIDNIEVYFEEEEAEGANHVLKVSTSEAKDAAWDSQVVVTLPTALEKGKTYTLNMKLKGSNKVVGQQGTYGWEALQPVFSDGTNPNYCSHFCLAEEWTAACTSDGGSITTDGKNAYTTLTFNLGALAGDMYIDDLTITDADGNVAYSNDFESPLEGIEKPSWHGHLSLMRVILEETVPATAPVTTIVTMPDAGYRTLAMGTPGINLSEGLKAYGAKVNESKTSVVLTEMKTVPAYQVAVLKGEPGAYLCVKNAPWASVSDISDLKFDWSNKTIAEGDNIYVLAQVDGSVVFAPASAGTLPARKGYLVIEGVSSAKTLDITFGDEATDIKSISTSANNSAVYNLAGQRVNANAKGIVIMNGRKYVQK